MCASFDNAVSRPTLENCIFENNRADIGGGLGAQDCTPELSGCTFVGNNATWGGGIANMGSPTISTDCVFSGDKGGYIESDFRDGKGYYAQSKALGELINSKDLTIRTSIIGPELKETGIGLFQWFSKQEGQIKGYTNAFWSGVTTIELAKAIQYFLVHNVSGLYHLTNSSRISKYDLLTIIKNVFPSSKVNDIKQLGDYRLDKSLVNTRTDIGHLVPSYEAMVQEVHQWVENHIELYPHYRRMMG